MRLHHEEGEVPPPPRRQGRDGYKVDIISSDAHCAAGSLRRSTGPGSIDGIDSADGAQSLDTLRLLTAASNLKFRKQNSAGDLIKTQKKE